MIGIVLDADGTPITGLSVETVEARWVTDDEGRFAVNYKEPSQYLHFQHEGMWYRRYYQPGVDDDKVITLQLPATTSRRIRCLHEPCDATLVFDLEDGFTATARGRCDDGEQKPIITPEDTVVPKATCRTSTTAPDKPIHPTYKLDVLQLSGPPATLTVNLFTHTKELPKSCTVRIDGEPAKPAGSSAYSAKVFGRVQYDAICDGVPATPAAAYVVGDGAVDLGWRPTSPTLDVGALASWATHVMVMRHAPEGAMWELSIPVKQGKARLPPLPAGTYKFGMGTTASQVRTLKINEQIKPGILQMVDVPVEPPGDHPIYAGAMIIEADMLDGAIPVEVLDTE